MSEEFVLHDCYSVTMQEKRILCAVFSESVTKHHVTKTSCFGVKSMALYGERKAFYDTKTTCFAVVEASACRSSLTCLSLKGL